jgi:hypothetical protein
MSGLQHLDYARRELELINENPAAIDAYLQVVAAFTALEKESIAPSKAIGVIHSLLQLKPLSPLTDDPDEWLLVKRGMWQSRRNAEAISKDGGRTYTLISEVQESKKAPKHESYRKGKK